MIKEPRKLISLLAGAGGQLQWSCSNFILTFLFRDVQGISRDLTSAQQKLTYLDTLSELLAHMASLHTINAACYSHSFDAYTLFFCSCFSSRASKSAPIAVLVSFISTVVCKDLITVELCYQGTIVSLSCYHFGITCEGQQWSGVYATSAIF